MAATKPVQRRTYTKPFTRPTAQAVEIGTVKEWFNRTVPIESMLEQYGYTILRNGYAVRPGGKRGTVRIDYDGNCSFHNNTNDKLFTGSGEGGFYVRPLDVLIKLKHKGDFMKAIYEAAETLGVRLVNNHVRDEPPPANPPPPPRYFCDEPPPANPPPPPRGVVVTNAGMYANFLKNEAGLDTILIEGDASYQELWKMVRRYVNRFLLMLPPTTGYHERLAANLEARFAVLGQEIEDNFMRLLWLLREAEVPEYRVRVRA